MSRLADNIRMIRSHYGFTQEFVSGKIGVSRAAFARWESGASSPHRSNRDRLADFFCVKTAQLEGMEPLELSWALARWQAREYENNIGQQDDYAGDLLSSLSDQAIVLEAAKRFYRVVIELYKLIESAERMDWESAAVAIDKASGHGNTQPEDKAYYLRLYELIGDLFGEINCRYSLYWVSRDQHEKMPTPGCDDVLVDYEELGGRHSKLLDRIAGNKGDAYKWLNERSASRQRFARVEDLIDAAKSIIQEHGRSTG